MYAIIQAGGLGTRLKPVTGDLPKPLVPLAQRPAIFHLVDWIRQYPEIKKVLVMAGYRGNLLSNALNLEFGDFVQTIIEDTPLGSGGCLTLARSIVGKERVLLIGGDLLVNLDFRRFLNRHMELATAITLTTHGNNHPYDADLIEPDSEGHRVRKFLMRPHPKDLKAFNIVNAGIILFESSFWDHIPVEGCHSFERDILVPYLQNHPIGIHHTADFIQDLGTPERLKLADSWKRIGSRFNFTATNAITIDYSLIRSGLSAESTEKRNNLIQALQRLSSNNVALCLANSAEDLVISEMQSIEMELGKLEIRVDRRQIQTPTSPPTSTNESSAHVISSIDDLICWSHAQPTNRTN